MDIAFIEFYDAEVTAITIEQQRLTVALSHVSVYELVQPEYYAVWSFAAKLVINGVHNALLRLAGQLPQELVDAHIDGSYPDLHSTATLLIGTKAAALHLVFRDGSELGCNCTSARLEIGVKNRRLDDWVGPLVSST
jgi:hypothetical protein